MEAAGSRWYLDDGAGVMHCHEEKKRESTGEKPAHGLLLNRSGIVIEYIDQLAIALQVAATHLMIDGTLDAALIVSYERFIEVKAAQIYAASSKQPEAKKTGKKAPPRKKVPFQKESQDDEPEKTLDDTVAELKEQLLTDPRLGETLTRLDAAIGEIHALASPETDSRLDASQAAKWHELKENLLQALRA